MDSIPSREFRNFLVGEIFAILFTLAAFRMISSRLVAGAVGGALFVGVGVWIFAVGMRSALVRKSATFFVGCAHLYLVSLPMLLSRFLNVEVPFQQIRIWGIPGPVFHGVSSAVFLLLILVTVADYLKNRKAQR